MLSKTYVEKCKTKMYKSFLLILIISFILSCIYEDERLNPQNNKKPRLDQDIPCWVIYPPEKCSGYSNCSNFVFFSSEIKLTNKIYDSTAENDLKIKIATQLFANIACQIESNYDRIKSCLYQNGEIICKMKNKRTFHITVKGTLSLGHIKIIKTYWRKNKNNWILFGLGKISKQYTDASLFYSD